MDDRIYATLVWYYYICRREVWLMANRIEPSQENENILMGRIIDQFSYDREWKNVDLGGMKFDIVKRKDGKLIIGETKKSSRAIESSKMQLAFYLMGLEEAGISAEGELRFPKEKKRVAVLLDDSLRGKLLGAMGEITKILDSPMPPPPAKCKYCGKCGYREHCWA